MKNDELFPRKWKGYDPAAVEQALSDLSKEKAELESRVVELSHEVERLTERCDELESRRELIEDTLVNATLAAEKTTALARQRADEIVRQAAAKDEMRLREIEEKRLEMESTLQRVEYILESQLTLVRKNKPGESSHTVSE